MSTTADESKRLTIVELQGTMDMHKRLLRSCYTKCVPSVHDADLAIGEMSCVDRCVPKYVEAHGIIQEEFQKYHEALKQTAVAMAGQPLTK